MGILTLVICMRNTHYKPHINIMDQDVYLLSNSIIIILNKCKVIEVVKYLLCCLIYDLKKSIIIISVTQIILSFSITVKEQESEGNNNVTKIGHGKKKNVCMTNFT